jgi:tetratricopeptide (TPR) repeat protein
MADSRIEDLRRRVHRDPASIAFAQLAEECRRAGQHQESIDVCRAGLAIHPGYLSARVTLGRALIELDQLDEAQAALELVLKSAPENLAAIRGLAEIHHRRGSLPEALAQYRAALALARNDPDLQRTVVELARTVEPPRPRASADGLSFEQVQSEFLKHSPPPVRLKPDPTSTLKPDPADTLKPETTTAVRLKPDATSTLKPDPADTLKPETTTAVRLKPDATDVLKPDATTAVRLMLDATSTLKPDPADTPVRLTPDATDMLGRPSAEPFDYFAQGTPVDVAQGTPVDVTQGTPVDVAQGWHAQTLQSELDTAERQLAVQTIAALERWLDAIHVTRAQRIA